MRTLSIDESGNSNLRRLDPNYPVFVLGGVIMENDYADTIASAEMTKFKLGLFGRADFVMHTADISRNRNVFSALSDSAFRAEFYRRLEALIRSLEFTAIACAIRANAADDLPPSIVHDAYPHALERLSIQLCEIVGNQRGGARICAESRSPDVDEAVRRQWRELRASGAGGFSGATFRHRVASLSFHSKAERIVGLELADLILTPIGRHVAGFADRPDWFVVREKLHRGETGIEIIPE